MAKWETELLRSDCGYMINNEYMNALMAGVSDEEAEQLVSDKIIIPAIERDMNNGKMWFALALCQWKQGRLSAKVKAKAQEWAVHSFDGLNKETVDALLDTLDSPMPERKKKRKPSHVAHCPWPVGSLLAYRIISTDAPMVTQSKYYQKYVLLRIVAIVRQPVSRLAPDACWHEQMIVGLYNWVGNAIPDPKIVNTLQYTEIEVGPPLLPMNSLQHLGGILDMREEVRKQLAVLFVPQIEKTYSLDWKCRKKDVSGDVFTLIDVDPTYQSQLPPFFETGISNRTLSNSCSFDIRLVKRFEQLANT